jgi:serine/threonine protein kinase
MVFQWLGPCRLSRPINLYTRNTQVAVKCVRTKNSREFLSFCRELEALSALRHPHVLPFLGACLSGPNGFWLVTEFMEQGTLAAWLYPHK